LRTVVVHHGSAQTHFDRDPEWRGRRARRICRAQAEMYRRPNRWFVAPADWAAAQFSAHYHVPKARVIAHWVEIIARHARPEAAQRRKLVLGDFRNFNKGRDVFMRVAPLVPELELRPLRCTYDTRKAVYAQADAYLNLSLSEGSSFALCDAEAAGLPLVTTDVGNFDQFPDAEVIAWRDRDRPEVVAVALRNALTRARGPSLYERFDLACWRTAWRDLLDEVAATPSRPALR
jgi:glycosyltransferase involved in cell wall biosynthesis